MVDRLFRSDARIQGASLLRIQRGRTHTIPDKWYDFTVTQRTISGAGVPTRTWDYQYSAANASWDTCTGSCPTTVWTDVINPDGSTVRRTFSNKFDISESHLLETDYYSGAVGSSTLMRSVKNVQYANPTPDPNTTAMAILGWRIARSLAQPNPAHRVFAAAGKTDRPRWRYIHMACRELRRVRPSRQDQALQHDRRAGSRRNPDHVLRRYESMGPGSA